MALDLHSSADSGPPQAPVQDAAALVALGNRLRREGRLPEAIAAHERAVSLFGPSAKACSDLGLANLCAGRFAQAVDAFAAALKCAPGHPELLYNLGTAELHAGHAGAAAEHLSRVVIAQPQRLQAKFNLALAYKREGHHMRALPLQREVHAAAPGDAEFEWGLGLTEIALGEFESGFQHFEARRRLRGYPAYARPWNGKLTEEPVTLYAEQGLGDTLQFARFLHRAATRTSELTLACQAGLLPLLQNADLGPVRLRAMGTQESRTELAAPLLSLPHLLGLAEEDLHAAPYLSADQDLAVRFAQQLHADDGRPLVGIFYQGNPKYRADRERSMPLSALAPLLARRDYRFVSFQKGFGHEQLLRLPVGLRPLDLGGQLDTPDAAFYETAAALFSLSALVTTDSAIAHLAGALGVPVVLMLPFDPDFRWGLAGSRWYASMRVIRQPRPGDWRSVLDGVVAALAEPGFGWGRAL